MLEKCLHVSTFPKPLKKYLRVDTLLTIQDTPVLRIVYSVLHSHLCPHFLQVYTARDTRRGALCMSTLVSFDLHLGHAIVLSPWIIVAEPYEGFVSYETILDQSLF
jgi:hypothetical protein